jgi:hypothetical protein
MSNVKWQRNRYVGLHNKVTHKGVIVDTFAVRMSLLKQRIFAWAEVMKRYATTHNTRMVMITLTYANMEGYQAGHIRDYVKQMKRKLGEKLIGFAWISELQKRGALHYHLILVVNKGTHIPMPDKSGMWKHGMSKIETARTPFYLVTYTGKEFQKDLSRYPKGARLYTASVRTLEGEYRHLYKQLAGLEKHTDIHKVAVKVIYKAEGWEGKPESDWEYKGAGITRDYVKDVLLSQSDVK